MLVPLSWLREYVDVTLEPEALGERLTLLGMEVRGIERRGADWQGVVVGELLEVKPHPNADRLSLTRVRTSEGGPELAIVCGATNIAAGQRVPVALPGAVLPGDRRIERAPKMGVVSEGMLCSGDELHLTTDADGILILPPDAPLGTALVDLLGDVILDIDVKPNRGDALSMVGLAREVAAATGATLRRPVIVVPETGDATTDHLSVTVHDPAFCTRFVGRYVDGVTVAPSPLWVQLRLMAAGQRPVSNVVDASNYVMLELGKPIHTFDAASVQDGHIDVRWALQGERLETLDHVTRELTPATGLIADSGGPLGIAGVMGGAASEVGAETRAVVIESAIFDPVAVRRTAHRYALRSEASLRFEKGQPHGLAREGADRTAQLIAAWAGGRVARGVIDSDPHDPPLRRVPFRPERVSRLLGVPIPAQEQAGLLDRVEVATEAATAGDRVPVAAGADVALDGAGAAEALVATIPAHRGDLLLEADLAEEVARVRGYETIDSQLPATAMPPYRPDPRRGVDRVRDLFTGRGLTELVTHALIGPDDHARLGWARDDAATIRVANPISPDHSQLRRSLLPGLVGVLTENERQRRPDVAVFEIGSTHTFVSAVPQEEGWLGILLAGAWPPAAWDRAGASADIGDAKGLVTWLADRLGLGVVTFRALEPWAGIEHPGRVAAVVLGRDGGSPVEIGRVGELHPQYLEACGSRAERVAFAMLRIDPLREAAERTVRVVPWPRVPAVERDLAVIVRAEQPAGEVEALIRAEAGDRLRALALFDRYAGPPLAEGEISLAYRLRLQAPDQTLTDADVDRLLDRVVAALRDRLGARAGEHDPWDPAWCRQAPARCGPGGSGALRAAGRYWYATPPARTRTLCGVTMDLLDGLRHFNLADVIIVLLIVGGFIFGFVTGVVQQLLTLLVWVLSLLLAGNIMPSLGGWMGQYWTTFSAPYSAMLAFLAMFVIFLVVGEIVIFIFYKRAPMVARLSFVDELVGGFLGAGIAILIIGAFVMGLDSFYSYNQVAASAQQPIAQVINEGLTNSVIAGWLRGSLIPAIGLLGPLLPTQLQNIV